MLQYQGFDFISQSSFSNAGEVGFYVRNDNYLNFTVLPNLTTSKGDFEPIWIEIYVT